MGVALKRLHVAIFLFTILFVSNCGSSGSDDTNVIFSDDFNRADSTTIGNNWFEGENGGDAGAKPDIYLADNKAVLQAGYYSEYSSPTCPSLSRNVIINVPVKSTIVFSVENSNYFSIDIAIYHTGTLVGNHVKFNSGEIIEGPFTGTQTSHVNSFPIVAGMEYTLTVSPDTGGLFKVRISDSGGANMNYYFPIANATPDFDLVAIFGGSHDGTTAYRTYVDSVVIEEM